MKRAISALILAVAVTANALPVFSQKRIFPGRIELPRVEMDLPSPLVTKHPGAAPKSQNIGTNTSFGSVQALTDGTVVLITWQMTVENQNFGFNVYQNGINGRSRINSNVILGGAGKVANRPYFGGEYQFLGSSKGGSKNSYEIETVSLSGKPILSEPVNAKFTANLASAAGGRLPKVKDATGLVQRSELSPDADLSSEIKENTLAPDPDMQKWIAAQPGVKIGVRAEGLYRVTKTQLQAAGFNVASDPSTWQLFTDGLEQSINVEPSGNYVEFYGKGIDRIESDTRIYYLLAGPTQGLRMATRVSRPSFSPGNSSSYAQTFLKKERTLYVSSIVNGDADNFFGNLVSSTAYTSTFNLSGIDTSVQNCTMTVRLQGFSSTTHPISVSINGHALAPMSGDGVVSYAADFTIPIAFLNEGANGLTMQSTATGDFSLFDQVAISFPRTFLASQNQLSFFTDNNHGAQLKGFTSANIRVFDTTYEGSPVQVLNPFISPIGGQFGVKLPAYRGRLFFVVEDSAVKTPFSLEANTPSTLSTTGHNADLVIVTYKDFRTQAETWATYRRGQGFSVEVVDVADIFDEFNYGVLSADSLKTFFQYAKSNWQTPPRYILLIGDASYDSRNYEGNGYNNLVPVKIITTLFSETGSDDGLVDFDDDGLAEIAIGRIPARTTQFVTTAFNKTVNFEQPANQTLSNGVLFAFDVDPNFDFGAMSGRLRDQLPAGTSSTMVSRGDAGAQQSLVNAINTGKYLVNYSGHGSTGVWATTGFFGNPNVVNCNGLPTCVNNPNHESVFLALTCLNGYFLNSVNQSLSETLLNATNGGAVAVWASTGETTPDVQEEMGQRFYSQVGTSTTMTRMGDFIIDSKSFVFGGPDVRLSFALIGDPMLKIKQ
ncbi:MAG: C25 family cysteine peptidase [Acidobacteriota bacterium]